MNSQTTEQKFNTALSLLREVHQELKRAGGNRADLGKMLFHYLNRIHDVYLMLIVQTGEGDK